MTPEEVWNHVDRSGDCWIWTGPMNGDRGRVAFEGRQQYAYRIAWQLTHGEPIPADKEACHRCDNPACVRPDHIFVGSHLDNMRDAKEKGRVVVPTPRFGVDHHRVTLTPELVAAAVAEYRETGATQAEVAARYGVSQTSVSNWIRGATRRDSGVPLGTRQFKPCGTRAAYERHRRNGEKPCEACRQAELQDQRQRRARRGAQAAAWHTRGGA